MVPLLNCYQPLEKVGLQMWGNQQHGWQEKDNLSLLRQEGWTR